MIKRWDKFRNNPINKLPRFQKISQKILHQTRAKARKHHRKYSRRKTLKLFIFRATGAVEWVASSSEFDFSSCVKLTSAWKLTSKIFISFSTRILLRDLCAWRREGKSFPSSPTHTHPTHLSNFFFDFAPNISSAETANDEHLLQGKESFSLSDYSIYVLQESFIILLICMAELCLCFARIMPPAPTTRHYEIFKENLTSYIQSYCTE